MHRRAAAAALLTAALAAPRVAAKATVGNFALSSTECSLFDVVVNPAQFGVWLTNATDAAGFAFTVNGAAPAATFDDLFAGAQGDRVFPACRLSTVLPSGLVVSVNTFAPISPTDADAAFLPLLVARFTVTNPGAEAATFAANYSLKCNVLAGFCNGTADGGPVGDHAAYGRAGSMLVGAVAPLPGGGLGGGAVWAGYRGGSGAGACAGGADACGGLTLSVPPYGGAASGAIVVGHHSRDGRYAASLPTPGALFTYAVNSVDALAAGHSAFLGALPSTGDAGTDAVVRWFLQAPVLLTKGVRNQTITMGYVELNQRDSFWSSWLHVSLWPALDADMVTESAAYQQPSGKIPTTVLPLILRDDNVDVTAYWVLRLGRHVQLTGDLRLAGLMYPALQRALVYLRSRDVTGRGVPQALNTSFWADWLDVPYVQGRRYAPHLAHTYLASLRVGAQVAAALGHAGDAAEWAAWYSRGYDFTNADFAYVYNASERAWDAAGLWNATARSYVDAWYDGRPINWTYADQAVGVFLGVVPPERVGAIDDGFAANGVLGRFGLRNVWPYFPWGTDPPGSYGNGGAYAWFNGIQVANRLRSGRPAAGAALFTSYTDNMLYRPDQPVADTPWEYVNADTGVDDGDAPQGWDGSFYLRATLGAWGWARASAPVFVHPHRPLVPLTAPAGCDATAPAAAAAAAADGAAWNTRDPFAGLLRRQVAGGDGASAGATAAADEYHVTLPHTLYRGDGTAAGAAVEPRTAAVSAATLLPLTAHGGAFLSVSAAAESALAHGALPAALALEVVASPVPRTSLPSGTGVHQPLHEWAARAPCTREAPAPPQQLLRGGGGISAPCKADHGDAVFHCPLPHVAVTAAYVRVVVQPQRLPAAVPAAA